jgi:hypothetical protein
MALLLLAACDAGYLAEKNEKGAASYPSAGTATLWARTTTNDYNRATLSLEFATTTDEPLTRNDWDLLFGNDRSDESDLFQVNMVTDDESAIYDLGEMDLAEVPETVDPEDHPVDLDGLHDNVRVELGHVYLLETHDSNTDLWGIVRVDDQELNDEVTVTWCRSSASDAFVATDDCLDLD